MFTIVQTIARCQYAKTQFSAVEGGGSHEVLAEVLVLHRRGRFRYPRVRYGLWGSAALDYVQVLLIFSWMGMLVHQFEEYAWPGGFPLISNMIVFNEIERPDRYILNQRQCFVSNVVLCYLCYIVPIFFPQLIWLAAAQIFQGLCRFRRMASCSTCA